jgi:hypothetical protein
VDKEVRVCWARDVQLRADLISAFPNGSKTGRADAGRKLNTLFLRHLGGKGDNVIMWDSVRM